MDNTCLEQNTCSCCQCDRQCNACDMNIPVQYIIETPKYCCGKPQAEPVCYKPCWDTCKCMEEILLGQKEIDDINSDIEDLDGRVSQVEHDFTDLDNRLTQQMGELAAKEQHDVDCLNDRVDGLEDDIEDLQQGLQDEIDRATGKEGELQDQITYIHENAFFDTLYVKNDKRIYFKDKDGNILEKSDGTPISINTSDFVVDGMIKSVEVTDRYLVIQWNLDATNALNNDGITRIPLTAIFNPDNYYDKTWINQNILPKINEQTFDNDATLAFGSKSTIAKVNNKDIHVTLPSLPTSVETATYDSDGNHIAHTYVSELGTDGNSVTWTKNGTVRYITVPYSTKAVQDANGDTITTTYLKSVDAANTYETQQHASNTYETVTHAANTYSTKPTTVSAVTLENDHLKITFADGSSTTCALPNSNIYVINLENRIAALEAMWQADSSTNTLSPKAPYVNVSMTGNATVGGAATITGNTSIGGNATITGSTTSNQFYDSDPNL